MQHVKSNLFEGVTSQKVWEQEKKLLTVMIIYFNMSLNVYSDKNIREKGESPLKRPDQ